MRPSSSPPQPLRQVLEARTGLDLLAGFIFLLILCLPHTTHAQYLGVCWGQVAHRPLPNEIIVNTLQANNISRVKLFGADPAALNALSGTEIEVMVMVRNEELQNIAVSETTAQEWLYNNVQPYLPAGIRIRYVSVGNEPFLASRHEFDQTLWPAFRNLHTALVRAGIDDAVKLTVSFNSEILSVSSPPSSGQFNPTWADQITNITQLISSSNSVFSVNIYPFFSLQSSPKIPLDFIMFDGGSSSADVKDNATGLVYSNIFDASFDALLAALDKIGFGNVPVILGEAGWPSDGDAVGNLTLAQRFNQGLVNHLLSGEGTPRRPNTFIPFYLFALLDEDAKNLQAGAFERRWGLYDDLGQPKYPLDLTGKSQQNTLKAVEHAIRLPKKWCTVKDDVQDFVLAKTLTDICGNSAASYNYADLADCTPVTARLTTPGLQCWTPGTMKANVSYVLNAYYQVSGQNDSTCTSSGVGHIVKIDPSNGSCTYSLGLDIAQMQKYLGGQDKFSAIVLGYLVALILLLANFL